MRGGSCAGHGSEAAQGAHYTASMGVEIPLFPLGVVLFPHMPLPLHIFEERYRAMMRDCEEQGTGFGIVAIREGQEVGRPAQPHAVGTLAQLRRVERLSDGRYNILVVGASRYRIRDVRARREYLTADIEYLRDDTGDPRASAWLAGRLRTAFQGYADRLRDLADQPRAPLDLPDDPELLGYLVAASLQVEVAHKQRLLELDSAEERLRGCLALLRREAALLERGLVRRELVQVGPTTN